MSIEEFQDGHRGSHLGCRNGMILTVLNNHISPMPLTKFQFNPTYSLKADVVSSWPPWLPSWIFEWHDISNSESLYCSGASHQFSAQSDLLFWRRCPL